jgi:hypothetical protein
LNLIEVGTIKNYQPHLESFVLLEVHQNTSYLNNLYNSLPASVGREETPVNVLWLGQILCGHWQDKLPVKNTNKWRTVHSTIHVSIGIMVSRPLTR